MSDAPLLELKGLSTHYVSARGTRVVRAVDEDKNRLGRCRLVVFRDSGKLFFFGI